MGVMNETVEDGVGISRVADEGMPLVDGDLRFVRSWLDADSQPFSARQGDRHCRSR